MSITAKPASEITFTLSGRDGAPDTKTNIAAYFKTAYNINLRYPNLVSALEDVERIRADPYSAVCLVRSEELCPHGVCCLGAVQRIASQQVDS